MRPLRCPKVERHPTAPAPSHLPQRRAGRGAIWYLRVVPLTPLNTSYSAIALRAIGQPGARRPPRLAKLVFSATRRTPAPRHKGQRSGTGRYVLPPARLQAPPPLAAGGSCTRHVAPVQLHGSGSAASCAFAQQAPPAAAPLSGAAPGGTASSPRGLLSLS